MIGKVNTLKVAATRNQLKNIAVRTIQESMTMNKDNLCLYVILPPLLSQK